MARSISVGFAVGVGEGVENVEQVAVRAIDQGGRNSGAAGAGEVGFGGVADVEDFRWLEIQAPQSLVENPGGGLAAGGLAGAEDELETGRQAQLIEDLVQAVVEVRDDGQAQTPAGGLVEEGGEFGKESPGVAAGVVVEKIGEAAVEGAVIRLGGIDAGLAGGGFDDRPPPRAFGVVAVGEAVEIGAGVALKGAVESRLEGLAGGFEAMQGEDAAVGFADRFGRFDQCAGGIEEQGPEFHGHRIARAGGGCKSRAGLLPAFLAVMPGPCLPAMSRSRVFAWMAAGLMVPLMSGCQPPAPTAEDGTEGEDPGSPAAEEAPAQPAADPEGWIECKPAGDAKWELVGVEEGGWDEEDGMLRIPWYDGLAGARWTGQVPEAPFEVELEAQRTDGSDFFCGLTVPTRSTDECVTLIVGGWGGSIVGISSINDLDASENQSALDMRFEDKQWYKIRLRFAAEQLLVWIDDKEIIDVDTTGLRLSLRAGPIDMCAPFGVASWQTSSELRSIRWRRLSVDE